MADWRAVAAHSFVFTFTRLPLSGEAVIYVWSHRNLGFNSGCRCDRRLPAVAYERSRKMPLDLFGSVFACLRHAALLLIGETTYFITKRTGRIKRWAQPGSSHFFGAGVNAPYERSQWKVKLAFTK